ncbi:MAG: TetR/AcrR family transcriptional regulator [Lachnospiraceae bacterium]|nr:TetR/AcrR family transcriptional regulator [Lachnospiraceae bacterium]
MQKGNERRKQLLSVALDEFITKGFYGTSTRSICRKAGIS